MLAQALATSRGGHHIKGRVVAGCAQRGVRLGWAVGDRALVVVTVSWRAAAAVGG
jgi:hypothetical protein